MSEAEVLARASARLAASGIPDPQREVRLLWRAAFPRRYADYEAAMAGGQVRLFEALVERRAAREPMSHLLGYRDFYEHRFEVSGAALDPRPETEELVRSALEAPFARVLDLGTGSGCILLSLLAARAEAVGVGTDLSEAALEVARRNVARLELETRAALIRSDWWEAVEGRFDLIVSNPPYIALDEMAGLAPELAHEPRMALTDEGDGLSAYRVICGGALARLESGGRLMVEIGPTQGQAVAQMMADGGLERIEIRPDLDGRDRVVLGYAP